jgi:predicted RND superfamily exporter protein
VPLLAATHRFPRVTLASIAIVTFAASILASRVTFQNAIDVWFVEDDPALATYDEFGAHFAADETIVLAVEIDALSDSGNATIARLANKIRKAPHVHSVLSVLDFDLDPLPDLDDWETDRPVDWDFRRRDAAQNHLITPTFISVDGHTAGLVIVAGRGASSVTGKGELVTALDNIVAAETRRSGLEFYLTGTPVLDYRSLVYSNYDTTSVYPLIVPLIFAICWLVFGSLVLALIPITVVAASAAWAFACMTLLGWHTNLLTSALLPFLLAVGVADSIHILVEFDKRRRQKLPDPAASAARHLWKPCLFTSLTTAAGLLALQVSSLRPVREFGVIAAIGVLVAFALSMTMVPALLQMFASRIRQPESSISDRINARLQRVIAYLANPPQLVVRSAVPFGVIVALLCFWSATRLEVGVDPTSWFRRDDPFRQATVFVDEQLGGAGGLEFLVRTPKQGLRDIGTLRRIDEFERWLEVSTLASVCVSGVDMIKEATRVGSEKGYRTARLPRTPMLLESIMDVLDAREELRKWITRDFQFARISCRTPLSRTADLGQQLDLINTEITARFGDTNLRVEPTGYGVLMVQMERHLVRSQIHSVAIAFAVVFLMLAMMIKSAWVGFVAMLPNLLPVAVGIGLMPPLGISLNPGSVMVAAIAVGIVVDDTTHLLVAMRRNLVDSTNLSAALQSAVREIGAQLALTSLILVGSMMILTFGSFAPAVHFGAITMVVVLVALFADLVILPRMLCTANKRYRLFPNKNM